MATTVTFDAFLAGMTTLGTVNTGDGGFQEALGAALLDSGKLKSWTSPAATAQQSGVLRARLAACRINSDYSTAIEYVDEPLWSWQEQGSRMIKDINVAIDHGDFLGAQKEVDSATDWGKLLLRAKICWDASLGHKVDAKDTNRLRYKRALSEWMKLERTPLNHHHHTVLYSEKEDNVPVASQVLKSFGSLLGGSTPKGLVKQLAQATAKTIGCSGLCEKDQPGPSDSMHKSAPNRQTQVLAFSKLEIGGVSNKTEQGSSTVVRPVAVATIYFDNLVLKLTNYMYLI